MENETDPIAMGWHTQETEGREKSPGVGSSHKTGVLGLTQPSCLCLFPLLLLVSASVRRWA